MYRIVVKKFEHSIIHAERFVMADSYEELRAIVTLAPEAGYEIISVERYDYELAKDFLQEIIKDTKPEDLVYGVDYGDDCTNCTVTKKNKKEEKK